MHRDGGRRDRARRIVREILSLVFFCTLLLAARSSLADHYRIPTGSMQPAVQVGDRVLVSKAAYDLRVPFTDWVAVTTGTPERGDVVILDSPDSEIRLLKRIVAVAGDRVAVRDGKVLLNGEPVPMRGQWEQLGTEHKLGDSGAGPDFGPELVPPGEYLVLGDDRGNSRDGRVFGFVRRSAIRGRAARVYYGNGGLTWRDL